MGDISGSKNPAWKGGWFINEKGYKRIRVGRSYRYEHRHNIEQHLGRKLGAGEDVHHIDGNKLNNDPTNLQVLSKREHTLIHDRVGEKNNKAKLKSEEVIRIRDLYTKGYTHQELGAMFYVDKTNISCITRGVTWKHLL